MLDGLLLLGFLSPVRLRCELQVFSISLRVGNFWSSCDNRAVLIFLPDCSRSPYLALDIFFTRRFLVVRFFSKHGAASHIRGEISSSGLPWAHQALPGVPLERLKTETLDWISISGVFDVDSSAPS
jgi:hypothetical protein